MPFSGTSDVSLDPSNLMISFDVGGDGTFSVTVSAVDDDDFEGDHSFVLSLPTNSDFINPGDDDIATTTITITDSDGEN